MEDWKFFHGTSSEAYKTIKLHGFILPNNRFQNFLAPQGLYLVPNRPLIARRFAKKASREDLSNPVVLDIKLNLKKLKKILDLTTETGMNRFFQAYVKGKSLYSIQNAPKLGKNVPVEYKKYIESIREVNKNVFDRLEEADNSFKNDPRRFNWDALAIRLITDEDKVQLIIAVIQEGTTFNFSFSRREPEFKTVPNYSGIRCRDHIEVCVTDLRLINLNSIRERSSELDEKEFEEDFIIWVTNIDAPDGAS